MSRGAIALDPAVRRPLKALFSAAGTDNTSVSTGTPTGADHFGWLVAATAVPEPAAVALLAVGALGLVRRRRAPGARPAERPAGSVSRDQT